MQEDAVEVSFCDLCGTSVPVGDLNDGKAVRHQGKTIGVCCLPVLRGERSAAAAVGAPAGVARPAAAESRLLTVAIVLLAAVAAATVFLDYRMTVTEAGTRASLERIAGAQRDDGEAVKSIAVAMDALAPRTDVDGLGRQLEAGLVAVQKAQLEMQTQSDRLQQEIVAVRREQQDQAAAGVDYRPQFEDLRQRQQRLAEMVAALAAAPPVTETKPAVAVPETPVPEAGGAPALPAPLAEKVKNLQAADPATRFEAVDELLRSKEQAVMPHLLPLVKDPDSFVRRLTVEGLADWKRPEAVEALLGALADADEPVRETAWRSLKAITGQKLPFEANGSREARARAVQRWQDWWDKNKATFGT